MAHLTQEKATRLLELLNSLEVKYGLPITRWEIGPDGMNIPDEQVAKIKNKLREFLFNAITSSIPFKEKKESPLDVLESVATAPFRFLKSLF